MNPSASVLALASMEVDLTPWEEGQAITGTYEGYFGEVPVSGIIEGEEVTLSIEVSAQGQDMKIDYVGAVEGDSMAGKVVFGSFGEGTFEGTREGSDED